MDHKSLHVRLRSGVLQVITSIVAFSVVVEYTGSSEYNYIVFTGVSGFVVALAFMACYAARVQAVRFIITWCCLQQCCTPWVNGTKRSCSLFTVPCIVSSQVRGKVSAVVDGVWWVFWLAAAAVATNLLTGRLTDNSRTRASCAFCWITW